ncbi:MAG: hypothetical protein AAGF28_13255 [Pseudomonadota bacterium]
MFVSFHIVNKKANLPLFCAKPHQQAKNSPALHLHRDLFFEVNRERGRLSASLPQSLLARPTQLTKDSVQPQTPSADAKNTWFAG